LLKEHSSLPPVLQKIKKDAEAGSSCEQRKKIEFDKLLVAAYSWATEQLKSLRTQASKKGKRCIRNA